MSNVCAVCGKHPVASRSISHSHRVTNRMHMPNIQSVYVLGENGQRCKMNVCAKCLKAGKVVRAGKPIRPEEFKKQA